MASRSRPLESLRPGVGVGAGRLLRRVSRVRELGLLIALLAIVIVVGVQVPRFLSLSNFRQILLSIAILAIVAVGETLVVLTRNVDLSVGSMIGLTAFIGTDLFKERPGISIGTVILVSCCLGIVLGAFNGLVVTVGRVPSIVATLGTLYVFRGIDFWHAGGKQVSADEVPAAFLHLAGANMLGIPVLVLIAVAITAVAAYFLRYSRAGRELYAIGSNPDAATMAGIPQDRLVFATFVVSGLLCGLAGILWGSRYGTTDARVGTGFEFQVIAAVVVGGVNIFGGSGTAVGAALGAVVLGTIANALTLLRLSPFWLQAISGAAILVAVTIDMLITRRLQRSLVARRRR